MKRKNRLFIMITIIFISLTLTGCEELEVIDTFGDAESLEEALIFDNVRSFKEGMAAVEIDGKWGYVNNHGEMMIEAIYDEAYDFNEDRAMIKIEEKVGYVNKQGEEIVEPVYDNIYPALMHTISLDPISFYDQYPEETYEEKYFIVENENGTGIFHIEKGIVIAPDYEKIVALAPDIFAVRLDDKFQLFNAKEDITTEFKYDDMDFFSEDRAPFRKESKWGYLNMAGEEVIPAIYDRITEFVDGEAFVKNETTSGIINSDGDIILEIDCNNFLGFYDNKGFIYKDGKWEMINRQGDIIIEPEFHTVVPPTEGMAAVHIMGEGAGYIDMQEETLIINSEFDMTLPFQDGYGLFIKGIKYGLVNKEGEVIVDAEYDNLSRISDYPSYYRISQDGKRGIKDIEHNRRIIEPIYDSVLLNKASSTISLEKENKLAFTDLEGNIIIDFLPIDDVHRNFSGGYLGMKEGEFWGFINTEGEIVIDPIYEAVGEFSEGYASVKTEKGWLFIDENHDYLGK